MYVRSVGSWPHTPPVLARLAASLVSPPGPGGTDGMAAHLGVRHGPEVSFWLFPIGLTGI